MKNHIKYKPFQYHTTNVINIDIIYMSNYTLWVKKNRKLNVSP